MGGATTRAALAKETTPIRYVSGAFARKSRIDFSRLPIGLGGTSVAAMERDVSIASMIVASSRGTEISACGLAKANQQRRERDEQDRRRHVAPSAGLAVDDVGEQRGRGELRGHSRPATVVHDVQGDDRRHGQQREQEERRLEAHRLRDLVRRKAASVRSQSPDVESTT